MHHAAIRRHLASRIRLISLLHNLRCTGPSRICKTFYSAFFETAKIYAHLAVAVAFSVFTVVILREAEELASGPKGRIHFEDFMRRLKPSPTVCRILAACFALTAPTTNNPQESQCFSAST